MGIERTHITACKLLKFNVSQDRFSAAGVFIGSILSKFACAAGAHSDARSGTRREVASTLPLCARLNIPKR